MFSPFNLPLPAVGRSNVSAVSGVQAGGVSPASTAVRYVAPAASELIAKTNLLGARVDGIAGAVEYSLQQQLDRLANPVNDCQRAVLARLEGQLASIDAKCLASQQCVQDALGALWGRAKEYAAIGGCPFDGGVVADTTAPSLSGAQPFGLPPPFCDPARGDVCHPPPPQPPPPPPPQPPPPPPFCDPALGVDCTQKGPFNLPPPPPPPVGGLDPTCANGPPPKPANVVNRPAFAPNAPFNPPPAPAGFYTGGGANPACIYGQSTSNPEMIATVNPWTGECLWSLSNGWWRIDPPDPAGMAWATAMAQICLCTLAGNLGGGGGGSGGGGGGGDGGGGHCPPPPVCPKCEKPACDCECLKKCEKENPKPKDKWCVYRRTSGTCYVVKQSEPTEIEGDELVKCFDNETEAIFNAQNCNESNKRPYSQEPSVVAQPTGGIWCQLNTCDALAAAAEAVPYTPVVFSPLFERAWNGLGPYDPSLDPGVTRLPKILQPIMANIDSVAYWMVSMAGSAVRGYSCAGGFLGGFVGGMRIYQVFVGLFAKFFGTAFEDSLTETSQTIRYYCPVRIPTSSEADSAYLSGSITIDQWRCWVRANGDCDLPRETIVDSKRQRLGVAENVALYMRGEIDQQEYQDRIRQLGFLMGNQADEYLTLAKQIPPVSELIRMMVRDVADENLVNKFGMDDEFADKWQGQLKEWGKNQGIPDKFAQYEWRAHWLIPSPGQLYQMYHRLRNLPAGDPNLVDLETIRTALAQQDILPFWQDKFIAISFNPLTRIDAGRAYEVGALPIDALEKAYLDLGYDDNNAHVLAQFKKRQLAVRLRSNSVVRLYRDGTIPRSKAYNMLIGDKFDPEIVDDALNYTAQVVAARSTAACVKALRKRFLLGEVANDDLTTDLNALGMDGEQANLTARQWICEKTSIGKLAPAATLCKWYKSRIINRAKYAYRLANLGWTADEIESHLLQCQHEIDDADLKARLKQQREQEAAAAKAARIAAQLAKQQQQQAEKLAREILREAKLSRKQQQNIAEAGRYVVKAGPADWMLAIGYVLDAIRYGMSQYQLDAQAAIDAALKAAKALGSGKSDDYPDAAKEAEHAEYLSLLAPVIDGSESL